MAGMEGLKNVIREPYVAELKPWKSIHDEIKHPMITGGIGEFPESVLASGFALITEPVCMGLPTHKHPFDQWIYLIGNSDNFGELDADIEFTIDGKIVKIDYPCFAFIPKGIMHCPVDVKRVGKPFIFVDSRVTEEASVRPGEIKRHKGVQYLTKQQLDEKKK